MAKALDISRFRPSGLPIQANQSEDRVALYAMRVAAGVDIWTGEPLNFPTNLESEDDDGIGDSDVAGNE